VPRAHDSDRKKPEQPTDDQQKVRAVARWENEGGAQKGKPREAGAEAHERRARAGSKRIHSAS
jgi:hypothetical protein